MTTTTTTKQTIDELLDELPSTAGFGELLKAARKQADLSAVSVGRLLEVSGQYIGDVERGDRAPLSVTAINVLGSCLGFNPRPLLRASIRERRALELELDASHDVLALLSDVATDLTFDRLDLAVELAASWPELCAAKSSEEQSRLLRSIRRKLS